LGGWQAALIERLAYWQDTVANLQVQAKAGMLRVKVRGPEGWLAYLRDRAVEQQKENEGLRHEVAVLEQEWQAQAGPGGRP
jgi:hypothetical protein